MLYLVKKLCLIIASGLFSAIEDVYRLFYGLATTKLFGNEAISTVSNNLYILVSIVILFAFAVKLIEAIVNPDLLTDSKKGVTGVLKRTIIGLILIVAIPNIFNFLYYFQYEVLSTALVEKIILGYTDTETNVSDSGGILTSTIITGFVYPLDENGTPLSEYNVCGDNTDCNYADELVQKNAVFEEYVSLIGGNPNYDDLGDLSISKSYDTAGIGQTITQGTGDKPYYHVSGLLIVAVGIYVLYQVITMSFDAALRLVNLGILEIIAPIIIIAYMAGGTDYLTKWAKMVAEKFLSIFIRIAALAFMILGLSLMTKSSVFNSQSTTFMFRLLVIIGLLRLVKDLPNIISKIFGVDVKTGGGIKGRLGEMAGIGSLAQNAWGKLGAGAKGLAATAGLAAAGGVGKGLSAAGKGIDKKFFKGKVGEFGRSVSQGHVGRIARITAAGVKTGGKGTAKALKDTYNKEYSDSIYDKEQKLKKEKSSRLNRMFDSAVGGILKVDAEGKINFNGNAKDILDRHGGYKKVADDILDKTKLISGDKNSGAKKDLYDYNSARDAYTDKRVTSSSMQQQKNHQDELINYINSLKESATNTGTQAELDGIVEKIKQGNYTGKKDDLLDDIGRLDFSDKSVTSELLGNLLNSGLSQAQANEIMKLKADWDSGVINSSADLETRLKSSGLDQTVITSIVDAADKTSSNLSDKFKDRVEILAAKEGTLTSETDLKEQIQTAQLDEAEAQKKLEKAKEAVDKRKESLHDGDEKDAFSQLFSDIDKMGEAEYKERMIRNSKE